MIPVGWAARWAAGKAFAGRVPGWAWLLLAAALAVFLGWRWHAGEVRSAERAGWQRGVDVTQAAYRRQLARARIIARDRRATAEAEARRINQELARETDRLRTRLDADAGRLLEQGPGRAACPGRVDHPGLSVAAAGAGTIAASGDALDRVPGQARVEFIGLPFAPTVALARNHDALRLEVLAWREWYRRQGEAWERFRQGRPAG